jgi:hypothetical protein
MRFLAEMKLGASMRGASIQASPADPDPRSGPQLLDLPFDSLRSMVDARKLGV